MTKPRAERRAGERGSYLVEYSFVFLVFLLMFFGIMEFGRAVAAYNVIAGATREGTRFAIVHGSRSVSPVTSTDIQNQVRSWCFGFDPPGVIVTTAFPSCKVPWQSV